MGILMWILVGLVAGWLTGKIMKGSGYGFFVDILLGIAGALVGGYIADRIGLDAHGGFHLQHTDRRGRRDPPGGTSPAAQARVKRTPSFPHRLSGKDRVYSDLTQILQLAMVAQQAKHWPAAPPRPARAPRWQSAGRRSCLPHRQSRLAGKYTIPA